MRKPREERPRRSAQHPRTSIKRLNTSRDGYARRLHCEALEDRRLLAVVTVDTVDDVVDLNDGVTSLREAIFATNLAPGADEISFDFGIDGPATILLTAGELEITDSLTLTGDGAALLTIDAQHQSRVFSFTDSSGDLTLEGVTLRNGRTLGFVQEFDDTTLNGGGIRFSSAGTLTIIDSTISGSITAGFNASGGGIFSDVGDVKLYGSTVVDNYTAGVAGYGGGIATFSGAVTLTDSTISANFTLGSGSIGGGINTREGDVTLYESVVSDNRTLAGGNGGGIGTVDGDVTLVHSSLVRNSTTGDHGIGGGIYTRYGNVSLTDSLLAGNFTTGEHARGGGVEAFSLTLSNSTISENYTTGELGYGGGAVTGRATLINSTLADNWTAGSRSHGGGMFAGGGVELVSSTVSGNSTKGDQSPGGGIFARGYAVTLSNSTLSGNGTAGYLSRGGGIYSTSGVSLYDSTLTGNTTTGENSNGGGIYVIRRSLYRSHATLTIKRSIVAGNSVAEGNDGPEFVPDFDDGTLTVEYSLIGDNSGTGLTEAFFFNPDDQGNMIGGSILGPIDPLLGPLADNGGPTKTHALWLGSPAINASDLHTVPGVDGVPEFDQRGSGFDRIVSRIDIGAYEVQEPGDMKLLVDTLVDESDGDYSRGDLSLREALELANANPVADTIRFDPILIAQLSPLPSTIVLT
ncbi:MAG: choice-of-anchor Q domain-containing protein, partial [Aeoliella sp.]